MGFPVKSASLRPLSFPERKPALLNSQLRQHVLISPSSSRSKNSYPIPQLNSSLNFWYFATWSPKTSSIFSSKYKKSERPKWEAQRLATLLLLCQSSNFCSASGNHNTGDLHTLKGLDNHKL